MIKALSYIGIKSTLRDEWAAFATKILGMQLIDKGGDTSIFRMDNQAQRLFVSGEQDESIACIGWEVETKASLEPSAAFSRRTGLRFSMDPKVWHHNVRSQTFSGLLTRLDFESN